MEVRLNQVTKKYGAREVLNIDELILETGKAYGIIGPNGAGKTTLFKCITNIIGDYQGEIFIDDVSVKEHNSILSNVGIVLDGISVYRDRTGWFNIEYFSRLRGNYNPQQAEKLAIELEISEYLHSKVKTYSYGMVKKLILLIALLHDPKILILDEPFRGLDSETVTWFKFYLKQMTRRGMSLIISSHVKNDIESLCEEVYILKQGQIIKHLNLSDLSSKMIRDVKTTNQEALIVILENANYYYRVLENGIVRLNIQDERWVEVKTILMDQNIDITELAKVNVLDGNLN
ncbi:ABC transporter ATP-binding protein [Vagococcus carniphilus]|uniref:ABC transporter ATP-binding protein n=1 Tax=Vagococcus carniphilus TaxID=218144 RepID=UPI002891060A|nr:ABC transporter ATP-binding protein [Vagococcus carniphilus]MDT2816060.1 ABC transporter ATP-binding protein [Vagococcus carniphilus]MDT2866378.1 ABC transporter ATP-binding protein [Vagococcus carniphilus]